MNILSFFQPISVIFLLTAMLSSCSTMEVEHDYNPGFNFRALKTFAVLYAKAEGVTSLNQERMAQALASQMERKGYVRTDRKHADFYLFFHTNVTDRTQVVTDYQRIGIYPYRFRPGRMAVVPVERTYSYREGKIIVDAVDPENRDVFWRAVATDMLKTFRTPEDRIRYINRVAREITGNFPSRQEGKPGTG